MREFLRLTLVLSLAFALGNASSFQPPPVTEDIRDAEEAPIGRAEMQRLGELEDTRIDESSGLALSRLAPDILWTHNDSGDGPYLFAFDTTGRSRGFFIVEGASAFDWEDMTSCEIDGRPHLLVADFGDNRRIREVYTLYLLEEPVAGADISHTGRVAIVRQIDYVYEDGRHDCEAIAVDDETGVIYMITKKNRNQLPCRIYRLDMPSESTTEPMIARAIGELGFEMVTAMDFSRDLSKAVVITYSNAYEFERAPDESWEDAFKKPWRNIPIPWLTQGESICYGPDNNTLYLTSENTPAPLWHVRILPD